MVQGPLRRLGAVVVLLGMALAACAGQTRGASVDAARDSLSRYATAVAAGDFEEAMAERCTAARVPDSEKSLFMSQAKRMSEALGPLSVASVRKVDPPSGLRPVANLPGLVEVSFRLSVHGTPVGTDLVTVLVEEHGKPKLCGFATEAAAQLHASLSAWNGDMGPTAREPRGLMPPSPVGYREVEDGVSTTRKPGVMSDWSRAWQVGDYGGARVTAWKYESAAQASGGAATLLDGVASDGVEKFDVPGLPGAVGIRYLGYAWLWVQPSTEGPYIDEVVMKFGDSVTIVTVSNLPTGSGHDVVASLAADVARLAHP